MTEGIWNDAAKTPCIDWTVSASLKDVERQERDVAEVTNLEEAVRAWLLLDPSHRNAVWLTVEHPIQLDGVATSHFSGYTLKALAEHLPRR